MYIKPLFRKESSATKVAYAKTLTPLFPKDFNEGKKAYILGKLAELPEVCEGALCASVVFCLEEISAERLGVDGDFGGHGEEYAVIFGEKTEIISPTENGLLLGFAALLMAIGESETQTGVLYSYPKFPMRGYRAFLPGRANFDEFKSVIDMMAYYQHNTLFLEVGGAMEYKLHPEINEKWIEYCADVRRYSGRAHEIQFGIHRWDKNSIHSDNGDGSYLSQDEVRELIAYCQARGMNVIPEVPTLSHCDYLVMAHPEIAERQNDTYPDTYCPNDPKSYELVFDILGEIIDVFKPNIVNIGHDECYSLCVCEKCAPLHPARVYADDIIKIHDYLAERGIKTLMWSEKLLQVWQNGNFAIGGLERFKTYPDGEVVRMQPKLYDCAGMIPRDVIMMHWYWMFDPETIDDVYHEHGYQMVYGNSSVMETTLWNERSKKSLGAIASNWGSFAPEYMQRNIQTLNLIYNARALAGHDYNGDEDKKVEFINASIKEAFRQTHKAKDDYIDILHTTDADMPYVYFYDGVFIEDEKYLLGEYELTFDDGTTAKLPVKYGTHISNRSAGVSKQTVVGNTMSEIEADFVHSNRYRETACSTIPTLCGNELYFLCRYANPHKGHDVVSYKYLPVKDAQVFTKSVARGKK